MPSLLNIFPEEANSPRLILEYLYAYNHSDRRKHNRWATPVEKFDIQKCMRWILFLMRPMSLLILFYRNSLTFLLYCYFRNDYHGHDNLLKEFWALYVWASICFFYWFQNLAKSGSKSVMRPACRSRKNLIQNQADSTLTV